MKHQITALELRMHLYSHALTKNRELRTAIASPTPLPTHQSSHPSFPPFFIAAVPIALPFFSPAALPASPKESQKSFFSGAGPALAPEEDPAPSFSTNLLNCSAAPLVPVWMVFAAAAAVWRVCAARSASAIYCPRIGLAHMVPSTWFHKACRSSGGRKQCTLAAVG